MVLGGAGTSIGVWLDAIVCLPSTPAAVGVNTATPATALQVRLPQTLQDTLPQTTHLPQGLQHNLSATNHLPRLMRYWGRVGNWSRLLPALPITLP